MSQLYQNVAGNLLPRKHKYRYLGNIDEHPAYRSTFKDETSAGGGENKC